MNGTPHRNGLHVTSPMFGRRRPGETPPDAPPPLLPVSTAEPILEPAAVGEGKIADLRTQALSRLDPSSVANAPPEALIPEVERIISEIATEKRIQLNGREQRQLATELVDDML